MRKDEDYEVIEVSSGVAPASNCGLPEDKEYHSVEYYESTIDYMPHEILGFLIRKK